MPCSSTVCIAASSRSLASSSPATRAVKISRDCSLNPRKGSEREISLMCLLKRGLDLAALGGPAVRGRACLRSRESRQRQSDRSGLCEIEDQLAAIASLLQICELEEKIGFDVDDHAARFNRMEPSRTAAASPDSTSHSDSGRVPSTSSPSQA